MDNSGDVGATETSLALDGSSFPHIVYYDGTNQDVKYAAWNGSNWDIETVDWVGGVGGAGEREQVVLAQAVEGDVPDDYHVTALFVIHGSVDDLADRQLVALRQKPHRLGNP